MIRNQLRKNKNIDHFDETLVQFKHNQSNKFKKKNQKKISKMIYYRFDPSHIFIEEYLNKCQ